MSRRRRRAQEVSYYAPPVSPYQGYTEYPLAYGAEVMPAYYPQSAGVYHAQPAVKKVEKKIPHTIDIIGNGPETTICGHISLLRRLPLHHEMHRQLLKKFKKQPGNYEGVYNDNDRSKATIINYGNGYLAITFKDDITRPEMSEFLLRYDWKMMNAHCATQNGTEVIYEKWTNVLDKPKPSAGQSSAPRIALPAPQRYY